VARASVRLAILRDRCRRHHGWGRRRSLDAWAESAVRKLNDLEVILHADEIRSIAMRIVRKVEGIPIPTPTLMLDLVQRGILHAWEHAGMLGLVQVHCQGPRILARVCYAAGDLKGVLRWYDAWEAECRRCRVDEIRIGGRPGWLRVSRKLKLGFEATDGGDIIKRLR